MKAIARAAFLGARVPVRAQLLVNRSAASPLIARRTFAAPSIVRCSSRSFSSESLNSRLLRRDTSFPRRDSESDEGKQKCIAYCAARSYDVHSLVSFLHSHENESARRALEERHGVLSKLHDIHIMRDASWLGSQEALALAPPLLNQDRVFYARFGTEEESAENDGHVFLFGRHGSMVFWGCDEKDCRSLQQQLQRFARKPFASVDTSAAALKEQEHDFLIDVDENNEKTHLHAKTDTLKLSSWKDTEGMFVVSYGLALSVMLSSCEDEIEKLVRETNSVPEELATKGETSLTHSEATILYGRLLGLRFKANLSSEVQTTPEYFWEHPHLEKEYHAALSALDVPGRFDLANNQMELLDDILKLIREDISQRNERIAGESSHKVEVYILMLIFVEILISVVELAAK